MNGEELRQYLARHKEELFDELKDEIDDNDITDIEWDGYNSDANRICKKLMNFQNCTQENFESQAEFEI